MMKFSVFLTLVVLALQGCSSGPKTETIEPVLKILNMNVFDQQQGKWSYYFRKDRLEILSATLQNEDLRPDIVFFQESQAKSLSDRKFISTDYKYFLKDYSYFKYTHESLGKKDGMSYGYLILSKFKPLKVLTDDFKFKGGESRRIQVSVWDIKELSKGKYSCMAVVNLHLSWQGSAVRYREVQWINKWIERRKKLCPNWLLLGDFNADEKSAEMEYLFEKGYRNLFRVMRPTVFPENKIRSIYGKVEPKTIDWALAKGFAPEAKTVFDDEISGQWLSDHAGIWVELF